MNRNVLTWNQAIERGYNPGLYVFNAADVPLGEYRAMLEFKIWSKKIMGINCYFFQEETANKFQLTIIYRQPVTEEYILDSGGLRFDNTPGWLCVLAKS